MTDARNTLEQELRHNEKEFAVLVTDELEQRFARFEGVTLAAVSKLGGSPRGPVPSESPTSASSSPIGALHNPGPYAISVANPNPGAPLEDLPVTEGVEEDTCHLA